MKHPNKYKSTSLKKGLVSIENIEFPIEKINDTSLVVKPLFMGVCRADIKEVVGSRDIAEDRGPLRNPLQ